MSEQKNNIPLVRLGDVAKWLRAGDRVHCRDENSDLSGECRITKIRESWASCTGAFLGLPASQSVTLLSPRLDLVPVDGVIKAGTPFAFYCGSWSGFCSSTVDEPVIGAGFYQLVRDSLPREVVAGPDTLRAGDRVEFVCAEAGGFNPNWNLGAPHRLTERDAWGWLIDLGERGSKGVVRVPDGWTVRLLSRANQESPVAEAQAEAGPQLEPDFTRVIRVGSSGEVEFINIASTNVTVAPKPAAPEKLQAAVEVCGWCREPFWAGRIIANKRNRFCADCEAFRVYPQDSWESNHPLRPAPDPHVHLTPAQRYHLDDDPDATGIPGGS